MPSATAATADVEIAADVFNVRDCALIAIATGTDAWTLKELRDGIRRIHPGSIYHHFWGGLLQPRFEEREYDNDFSAWVQHGLHDAVLAERLAAIAPTDFAGMEDLRQELVEIIEERLDESDRLAWLIAGQPFQFIQSQMVVFDTRTRVGQPEALAQVMPLFATGTVFYHFIDARRRSADKVDDFSAWLASYGDRYAALIQRLANVDPYFGSLTELRQRLAATFAGYFGEKE